MEIRKDENMNVMIIFLVLLPLLAVLAMISRKHFSKYKGGEVAERLQKVEVLYGRRLEDAAQQYIEREFRLFLILLGVLWFAALGILLYPAADQPSEEIERPAAGENATEVTVHLSDGEKEELVTLAVNPRRMTEEEFDTAAKAALEGIRSGMAGKNQDLMHVTQDLVFPSQDKSHKLKITWETDHPTVLSRKGKVRREELTEALEVTVKARVTDDVHEAELSETVTVLPANATETALEKAERVLIQQEESGRNSATYQLPDKIGEVEVKRQAETVKGMICKLYIFAVILIIMLFLVRRNKEKEKLKEREAVLGQVFYRFVKRLTLLVGAGDNLQNALVRAAEVEKRYLLPEVWYILNSIRSGTAEQKAYTELGKNLGLKNYIRLFSTISTTGPRGSNQLIQMLEQEVQEAETEKRDEARKKGEQAQEKLLIPMVILMATVIGIVLYPAIVGM